jgi:hypothetical protein
MKIVYRETIYESTLLEMPARAPSQGAGEYTDERELKDMNNMYDPMHQNVVLEKKIGELTYYILEEKAYKNSGNIFATKDGGFIGYITFEHFKKDYDYPNAVVVDFTFLLSKFRGSGIMVDAYRILIDHYGAVVSDRDLTPESNAIYMKLAKEYKPFIFNGEFVEDFDFTNMAKLKETGNYNNDRVRFMLGKK